MLPKADRQVPLHMQLTEAPRPGQRVPLEGRRIRLGSTSVDISSLIPLYGSAAVSRWLDAIAATWHRGSLPRPAEAARTFAFFLRHIAGSDLASEAIGAEARVYHQLMAGDAPTSADLEDCFLSYIERARDLAAQREAVRTRLNRVARLRAVLLALGPALGWPAITFARNYGTGLRIASKSTLSLGEMQGLGEAAASGSALSSNIMQLNKLRLSALREVLCEIFDASWHLFLEGRKLISRTDLPDDEELSAAIRDLPTDYAHYNYDGFASTNVNRCFPLDDVEFRRSSLLKYIINCSGGALRLGRKQDSWWRLLHSCGGAAWLAPRIAGDGRALAAAQGIVLVDTGFNLQPCNDLLADPVITRARQGNQTLSTVTSQKMRAGGKLVLAVLREYEADVPIKPNNMSALVVIERWREMSSLFREYAKRDAPHLAKYLWIRAPLNRLGDMKIMPNEYQNWNLLQDQFSNHPALRGLKICRRNIRTTVLQIRMAHSELDVAAATLSASHGRQATTIRNYLNRGWFHSEMDELIRRFQNQYEAILLPPDAGSAAGLSDEEFDRRRRAATESGLGLLCIAPRTLPPTPSSNDCLALERCSSCSMMRFSPTDSALRALILTERSLSAAQAAFENQNPERWRAFWLPTLALVRAIVGRLQEGHHQARLRTAVEGVDNELAAGTILAVRPW